MSTSLKNKIIKTFEISYFIFVYVVGALITRWGLETAGGFSQNEIQVFTIIWPVTALAALVIEGCAFLFHTIWFVLDYLWSLL